MQQGHSLLPALSRTREPHLAAGVRNPAPPVDEKARDRNSQSSCFLRRTLTIDLSNLTRLTLNIVKPARDRIKIYYRKLSILPKFLPHGHLSRCWRERRQRCLPAIWLHPRNKL